MSKKSRKRNKRILGVLGALGAAALLGRNKGTAAADVDSGRGGDSSSAKARVKANAVTGTEYPGANKVVAAPIKKSSFFESKMTPRRTESTWENPSGTVGTNKKASIRSINAAKMAAPKGVMHPILTQKTKTPVRTYGEISPWAAKKGGRAGHNSGGRVKGVGKAKRGFGRALKGGK